MYYILAPTIPNTNKNKKDKQGLFQVLAIQEGTDGQLAQCEHPVQSIFLPEEHLYTLQDECKCKGKLSVPFGGYYDALTDFMTEVFLQLSFLIPDFAELFEDVSTGIQNDGLMWCSETEKFKQFLPEIQYIVNRTLYDYPLVEAIVESEAHAEYGTYSSAIILYYKTFQRGEEFDDNFEQLRDHGNSAQRQLMEEMALFDFSVELDLGFEPKEE